MVAAATAERLGEPVDLARDVGAHVDRGVELASGEHRQVAVAVGQQVLGVVEGRVVGLAAVQESDVVAASRAASAMARPTNRVPPMKRMRMVATLVRSPARPACTRARTARSRSRLAEGQTDRCVGA